MLTVHVRTVQDMSTALGWAGPHAVVIDRALPAGGQGLGFSGGDLLFLAIGACYCNDLYREADRRGLRVKSVAVDVSGEWAGEPLRAHNVSYSARVEADASEQDIRALMAETASVAEIVNSLRCGTPVAFSDAQAISLTVERSNDHGY